MSVLALVGRAAFSTRTRKHFVVAFACHSRLDRRIARRVECCADRRGRSSQKESAPDRDVQAFLKIPFPGGI